MGAVIAVPVVSVHDVCEVERARAGKMYPAGTCYVALSATNDIVNQLAEDSEVETRYAVIVPRDASSAAYLKVVLERAFPRFLMSHRTGVNLKFEELAQLEIEWHDDERERAAIVNQCAKLDELTRMERQTINELRELKQYMLLRMFADGMEGKQ